MNAHPDAGRETAQPPAASGEGASALIATGEQRYGPYASQRGRNRTPDPFLFGTTIFLEHEAAPNEAQDDPMGHLRSRLRCVEHNVETLRTRLTQVADLRDAQGIRRDHRTIVARLEEVEEYASANTFREFMVKIQRLESMLVTDGGGSIGEAIRVCTRRIEQQQASLDDVRSRMYTPDGQGEWSENNSENISGRDNRPPDRRRRRGIQPQGVFRSPMPRAPPPPVSESSSVTVDQSSINRLYGAYTQCVSRTNHLEHRFDQFRQIRYSEGCN